MNPPPARCYVYSGILTTAAVAGVVFRAALATGRLDIDPTPNMITMAVVLALVIAAIWYPLRLRDRRQRAEIADLRGELTGVRDQVAALEDQAWWGKPVDLEKTMELGTNVVPIRKTPPDKAKGSAG